MLTVAARGPGPASRGDARVDVAGGPSARSGCGVPGVRVGQEPGRRVPRRGEGAGGEHRASSALTRVFAARPESTRSTGPGGSAIRRTGNLFPGCAGFRDDRGSLLDTAVFDAFLTAAAPNLGAILATSPRHSATCRRCWPGGPGGCWRSPPRTGTAAGVGGVGVRRLPQRPRRPSRARWPTHCRCRPVRPGGVRGPRRPARTRLSPVRKTFRRLRAGAGGRRPSGLSGPARRRAEARPGGGHAAATAAQPANGFSPPPPPSPPPSPPPRSARRCRGQRGCSARSRMPCCRPGHGVPQGAQPACDDLLLVLRGPVDDQAEPGAAGADPHGVGQPAPAALGREAELPGGTRLCRGRWGRRRSGRPGRAPPSRRPAARRTARRAERLARHTRPAPDGGRCPSNRAPSVGPRPPSQPAHPAQLRTEPRGQLHVRDQLPHPGGIWLPRAGRTRPPGRRRSARTSSSAPSSFTDFRSARRTHRRRTGDIRTGQGWPVRGRPRSPAGSRVSMPTIDAHRDGPRSTRPIAGAARRSAGCRDPASRSWRRRKRVCRRMGTEVAVVGAGFSGLAAALALARAGARTRVLEARDRVGGRVLTRWLARRHPARPGRPVGRPHPGPGQRAPRPVRDRHLPVRRARRVAGDLPRRPARRSPRGRRAGPRSARRVRRTGRPGRAVGGGRRPPSGTVRRWPAGCARPRRTRPPPGTSGGCSRAGCWPPARTRSPCSNWRSTCAPAAAAGRCSRWPAARSRTGSSADRRCWPRRWPPPSARTRCGCPRPCGPSRRTVPGVVVHTDTDRVEADAVVVAVPPTLAGRIRYDPPLPPLR